MNVLTDQTSRPNSNRTVYTENMVAIKTHCLRREEKIYNFKLDPSLNCLQKYTLNQTKQKDVFHQFSFDPYS